MNTNTYREKNSIELMEKERNSLSKTIKRDGPKIQTKSIDKLSELNLDIENLYKKYTKIKKERLMKEKSQQILVNRIKVLRNQQNSSKKKENLKNLEKCQKIQFKVNNKYKNSAAILKRYRFSERKHGTDFGTKNITSTSINRNKKKNLNGSKEDNNKGDNKFEEENISKGSLNVNNIEDFLKKYKYNIGNKNSNNNIYIIINNPNNFSEKKSKSNDKNRNLESDTFTYKSNDITNYVNRNNNNRTHVKSDIDLDSEIEGENIILMKTDGRNIKDIIDSINRRYEKNKFNTNESIYMENKSVDEKYKDNYNYNIKTIKNNDDQNKKIINNDNNNIAIDDCEEKKIKNNEKKNKNVEDTSKDSNNKLLYNEENKEIQNDNTYKDIQNENKGSINENNNKIK